MKNITVEAASGHGKACAGYKRSSTIQVREHSPHGGYFIRKQFRFVMGDRESLRKATFKAMQFAKDLRQANQSESDNV